MPVACVCGAVGWGRGRAAEVILAQEQKERFAGIGGGFHTTIRGVCAFGRVEEVRSSTEGGVNRI